MSKKGPNKPKNESIPKNKLQGLPLFTAHLTEAVKAHEAELSASIEDLEDLEENRATELLFRTTPSGDPAAHLEATLSDDALTATLTDEHYSIYHQNFSENPYSALAELIQKRNNEVLSSTTHGQTPYFIKRLQNINPTIEFAVRGAITNLQEARKSGDNEAIKEATAVVINFKKIQEMYASLEALANNKSRYSKAYYDQKVNDLLSAISDDQQIDLKDAIDESVGSELFTKRHFYQLSGFGSTEFDTTLDKLDLEKYTKRVKIEHEKVEEAGSENVLVKGKFSYNRSHLLDSSGIKKYWGDRNKAHQEMQAQMSDFVTVALYEYKVGTSTRPINIKYMGDKGTNMSDMSMAILMEYKKRAILEGKSFYAKNPAGVVIQISPSTSFTPEEKAYFLHFATQTPVAKTRSGLKESKHCAGAGYLNIKSDEPDILAKAMENHLVDWREQYHEKMDVKMDKVASQLSKKAESKPGL